MPMTAAFFTCETQTMSQTSVRTSLHWYKLDPEPRCVFRGNTGNKQVRYQHLSLFAAHIFHHAVLTKQLMSAIFIACANLQLI